MISQLIRSDVIIHALELWELLEGGYPGIQVPDIEKGSSIDNNSLLIRWYKDEHYLECEVYSNGVRDWLYKNAFTKEETSFFTIRNESHNEYSESYDLNLALYLPNFISHTDISRVKGLYDWLLSN